MHETDKHPGSIRMEILIGKLLKIGVLISSAIVLIGGILFMMKSAGSQPQYGIFKGEPIAFRTVGGIFKETFSFSSRGIMQLGILLLLATPIMRVLLSVLIFIKEKDKLYIVVTSIVLAVLIYSVFFGG